MGVEDKEQTGIERGKQRLAERFLERSRDEVEERLTERHEPRIVQVRPLPREVGQVAEGHSTGDERDSGPVAPDGKTVPAEVGTQRDQSGVGDLGADEADCRPEHEGRG